MYGAERDYWDLELGGGIGTTELIRRLYPHRRREIKLYNPIKNTMPDWMPGSGEKSPDFRHGDPYTKVAEGEMRLPGVGYAALNPELRDVDPADYPLIHRFQILGDIAPYSSQYKQELKAVKAAREEEDWTEEQERMYQETIDQIKQKREGKKFAPYRYKKRAYTPIEEVLARANEEQKTAGDQPGWFERTMGRYWEEITHGAESPLEFLTPMSPGAKLIHQRTAVEDYERMQVYGTESAFWGHPVRDFLRPFVSSTGHALGWDGIPEVVQEKRELEEYFDILKYVKNTKLKREAQAEGDEELAKRYERQRRQTLFGLNPFTRSQSDIYRALPKRERDYFEEFTKADMEERKRILEMIPENEKALMLARWQMKDASDMEEAIERGLLDEQEVAEARESIDQLYENTESQGLPKSQELWAEYLGTRIQGESYPDWYRRVKLLAKKLEGRALPGADWVGWHPSVDLEDIKLKIVENEGRNMYDYELWGDRQKKAARMPYLDQAAETIQETEMTPGEVHAQMLNILEAYGVKDPQVQVIPGGGLDSGHDIHLDVEADRTADAMDILTKDRLV